MRSPNRSEARVFPPRGHREREDALRLVRGGTNRVLDASACLRDRTSTRLERLEVPIQSPSKLHHGREAASLAGADWMQNFSVSRESASTSAEKRSGPTAPVALRRRRILVGLMHGEGRARSAQQGDSGPPAVALASRSPSLRDAGPAAPRDRASRNGAPHRGRNRVRHEGVTARRPNRTARAARPRRVIDTSTRSVCLVNSSKPTRANLALKSG